MNLVNFILDPPSASSARLVEVDHKTLLRDLDAREIRREVAERAAVFRHLSSAPGDRFFIHLPHSLDFALDFLACVAAGGIAVPLSPALTATEVERLAERFRPRAVVGPHTALRLPHHVDAINPDNLALLRERERRHAHSAFHAPHEEDPAWMVFTSGTSAEPRGVLHAHRSVRGRLPMIKGWTGIHHGDVVLHTGTLNWTYAMGLQILDAIRTGATSVIHVGSREPDCWGAIVQRWSVTLLAGVPSLYRRILKYDPDPSRFSTLRTALTAGEALTESIDRDWTSATHGELHEAFGMSECSTFISTGPDTARRLGTPGRPQAGRRVVILPEGSTSSTPLAPHEPGLLAVHRSDPGLMLEYADDPVATRAAFRGEWFLSGDLGSLDQDGYFHFSGRAGEVINPMGHRVSPLEVEAVLRAAPNVRDVAVAETQIRPGVVVIGALIVPREPEDFSPESLRAWMQEHLARWKQPRRFRLVEELPRSANGKVLRRQVDPLLRADGRSLD